MGGCHLLWGDRKEAGERRGELVSVEAGSQVKGSFRKGTVAFLVRCGPRSGRKG